MYMTSFSHLVVCHSCCFSIQIRSNITVFYFSLNLIFSLIQQIFIKDLCALLLEWPKSGTLTRNAGEDVEQQQLLFINDRSTRWFRHFEGSQFGSVLQNQTPNHPTITLLLYPKELKAGACKNLHLLSVCTCYTGVYSSLLIIARTWKQLKYS